jgi:hypothetical protein
VAEIRAQSGFDYSASWVRQKLTTGWFGGDASTTDLHRRQVERPPPVTSLTNRKNQDSPSDLKGGAFSLRIGF